MIGKGRSTEIYKKKGKRINIFQKVHLSLVNKGYKCLVHYFKDNREKFAVQNNSG